MTDEKLAEEYTGISLKEELEREYHGRRPTEPYSEDDSPNDWANIVQYAEENLDKAFKAIAELEKENAELDCQMNRNKYCYSCTNVTDRCFRNEIGCPCAKYKSYKDENAELKEENKFLKEQCLILADGNVCSSTCSEIKKQLTKAKEIIKDYMTIAKGNHTTVCGVSEENRTINVLKLNKEAEQFLNSEVEK